MNSFLNLVGFEYKKIVKRKSFIFALIIMLFMATFCMVANVLMGNGDGYGDMSVTAMEALEKQREAEHKEAGYFDDVMINKIIEKNVIARDYAKDGEEYPDDIYKNYIFPYRSPRSKLAIVLSPINSIGLEKLNSLDSGEGIDYYALRNEKVLEVAHAQKLPEQEIKAISQRNATLATPFFSDFFDGYSMFLVMMTTSAVFIVLALAMCIAPIFSDEYQKKTDSIILSSKYGKNKLITAKIFTVITFSFLFTITALIIALITTLSVYSTIGGNVSFQMWKIFSIYPITMAKAVLIYCVMIVFAALLICAICTLLSACFSSFATIITITLLLIGGMFLNIKTPDLKIINYFFPSKMMDSTYVFSDRLVNFFGIYMEPYVFIPIICTIMIAIFILLAYRKFKNHQVG